MANDPRTEMSSTAPRADQRSARPARAKAAEAVTALVVDGDAVSRRFVELALGKAGGFSVETVNDGTSALEVLSTQLFDLIVCETDLHDMSGLRLYRRLAQERRLRSIPFVFLSADKRPDIKALAFDAGVDDYLIKPCDVAEFVARARAHVARHRRDRDAARAKSYTLAGDFSTIAFPDLVSIVEMGRRTGVLSVVNSKRVGKVYFDDGHVVHATCGNLAGAAAFYQLIAEPNGQFEFAADGAAVGGVAQTISGTATALIMEGARLADTARYEAGLCDAAEGLFGAHPSTLVPPSAERAPSLRPETTLAAQFDMALRDPFALGELRLWNADELAKWTAADLGRDRLHVHLVADRPTGVSAILALAGAPTERFIMGSVRSEPKIFGLTFFLRHERTIDVVLLDVEDVLAFESSLMRRPAVTIVAPSAGDLMSIGTRARVELDELLDTLRPPAVVGVGNAALDAALRSLDLVSSGKTLLRCAGGVLGEEDCDLRSALVKAVRLWAASGARPAAPGDS